MDDLINSLLVPRRSAIKAKIAAIQDNQAYNRKTLAEITLLREQGHADFEAQLEELNAATEAVDDVKKKKFYFLRQLTYYQLSQIPRQA